MPRTSRKDTEPAGRPAASTIIYVLIGPIVWALHFFALYGPQSMLCARGLPEAVPPIVAVATLAAAATLLFAIWRPGRLARLMRADGWPQAPQQFLRHVMQALAVLSLFAVAAAAAVALFVPSCAALR
jgi:hypothetical protein